MNKKPVILMMVGLLLFVVGVLLSVTNRPPAADAAATAQCAARMKDQGADMVAKCREAAFATAMTATDADAAARAIGAANQNEIGGNMIGTFLIGVGLALAVGGYVAGRRRS